MCFVWIWEQTAIISLYSVNWEVFIYETECVFCAVRRAECWYKIRVNFLYLKGQLNIWAVVYNCASRKISSCHHKHQQNLRQYSYHEQEKNARCRRNRREIDPAPLLSTWQWHVQVSRRTERSRKQRVGPQWRPHSSSCTTEPTASKI
jgi:hypothetical protein